MVLGRQKHSATSGQTLAIRIAISAVVIRLLPMHRRRNRSNLPVCLFWAYLATSAPVCSSDRLDV